MAGEVEFTWSAVDQIVEKVSLLHRTEVFYVQVRFQALFFVCEHMQGGGERQFVSGFINGNGEFVAIRIKISKKGEIFFYRLFEIAKADEGIVGPRITLSLMFMLSQLK
jgi:hypothetical protein